MAHELSDSCPFYFQSGANRCRLHVASSAHDGSRAAVEICAGREGYRRAAYFVDSNEAYQVHARRTLEQSAEKRGN